MQQRPVVRSVLGLPLLLLVLLVAAIMVLVLPGCATVQTRPAVTLDANLGDRRADGSRDVTVVATSGDSRIDFGSTPVVQVVANYHYMGGDSLRFILWFPPGKFDSTRLAVLIHGYDAPIVSLYPLAIETVRIGMPTLMISLRGSNLNSHLAKTYGLDEIDDVQAVIAAYQQVMKLSAVPHVSIFGTSVGAFVAANVAAEDSSVERVVLEGLMANIDVAARRLLSEADYHRFHNLQQTYLDASTMDPINILPRLSDVSRMLIWGADDDITPEADRLRLVAQSGANTVNLTIPGVGHSLRYGFPLSQQEAINLNRRIAAFMAGKGE